MKTYTSKNNLPPVTQTLSNRSNVNKKKHQKGTALVEFAIVASVFLMLLFTVIDFAIYGYIKLTMQHAIREGARYAVTGRSDLDPDANNNREAAILEKMNRSSNGEFDNVVTINGVRVEDVDGQNVVGFGQAGEIIAIHVDCEWPAISPFIYPLLERGKYQFTVSATMRNELY